MNWNDVRQKYKNIWVLIEELEFESNDLERTILEMKVINNYNNGIDALNAYRKIHK